MQQVRALAIGASVFVAAFTACESHSRTSSDGGADADVPDAAPSSDTCRFDAKLCPGDVQTALQARLWVNPSRCSPEGTPGLTCTVVSFEADGSYHWRVLPPSTGSESRQGKYRAQCSGPGTGLIRLDDDSAMAFELIDPQLLMLGGLELFAAPKPAAEAGDDAAPEPPRQLPEHFCELAQEPWVKINHFDTHTFPDRIAFKLDGSAELGYRAGACSHGLEWGVMNGDRLVAAEHDNTCDERRASIENRSYDWPFEIDADGILYMLAEYRRESDPHQNELLRVRTADLVLSLELSKPLQAFETIHYSARLERRGAAGPLSIGFVRAELIPIEMRAGRATQRGPIELLFDQHPSNVVASGQPATFEGELRTDATGEIALELSIAYRLDGAEVTAESAYIATL